MTSGEVSPFERRTRACQDRLDQVGADAVVLFPSNNLYYTSGYTEEPGERHFLLFIPADSDPIFLVPELSGDQVREASWVPEVRTWRDEDGPAGALHEIVQELDLAGGELLVDDTMWAVFTQDLREVLPEVTFGLASAVLSDLRITKDEAELDAMAEAADITDQVVGTVRDLGSDAIGMTEAELAGHIESQLDDAGGSGTPFETIVGSGPNSAKPHHTHGDREIQSGDPVVLDFGTTVDNYPSDQTRTVVFDGAPSATFREGHELVREAQIAGIQAVEPGVTASAVDAAVREVIEAAGYGERFIHRTGHGVGLSIHEEPYIVEGNDRELEEGMVFSIEPGVYLPGEFGVRIEDLVVVTEDGCERLNTSDRGWEC